MGSKDLSLNDVDEEDDYGSEDDYEFDDDDDEDEDEDEPVEEVNQVLLRRQNSNVVTYEWDPNI